MTALTKGSATRNRLFRINPHCFWCGKLTVLSFDVRLKHDAATVDHLYSRLHPDRKAARKGRGRLVLACNQCNKDRSVAETRGLMFVPKLGFRAVLAQLSTVSPLDAPIYKGSGTQPHSVVENPPKDYGWVDADGYRRPRDWEEHCKYFREAERVPENKYVVPVRRKGLATIGEILACREDRLTYSNIFPVGPV